MQSIAKAHHHRKHKQGKAIKVVMLILAVGVVLAVVVGLLVLMNNPSYESRQ